MLESYKWMGWDWDGMGMGWKSLRGVILRAPLCGANNLTDSVTNIKMKGCSGLGAGVAYLIANFGSSENYSQLAGEVIILIGWQNH